MSFNMSPRHGCRLITRRLWIDEKTVVDEGGAEGDVTINIQFNQGLVSASVPREPISQVAEISKG